MVMLIWSEKYTARVVGPDSVMLQLSSEGSQGFLRWPRLQKSNDMPEGKLGLMPHVVAVPPVVDGVAVVMV